MRLSAHSGATLHQHYHYTIERENAPPETCVRGRLGASRLNRGTDHPRQSPQNHPRHRAQSAVRFHHANS